MQTAVLIFVVQKKHLFLECVAEFVNAVADSNRMTAGL